MTGFELIKLCARFDFGEPKVVAKVTLVALATFFNEERGGCWPAHKDLLPIASCDRKALLRAIAWLEEREIIWVERVKGKGNFYRFNEEVLLKGSYQKNTSPLLGTSTQKNTGPLYGTGTENGMTHVPKEGLHMSPNGDGTSPQMGTQIKKKKEIKEKEKINRNFFLMTDAELVEFFSSVSHEEGIEARAEYTRRVEERNKSVMMSDFDMPSRPRYQILGMKH